MPGPAFGGAGAEDETGFTRWAGGCTGGGMAPAGPGGLAIVVSATNGGGAVVVDGTDSGWAQAPGADNAGPRSAGRNVYTATIVKTTIPASEIIAIIALSRIKNERVRELTGGSASADIGAGGRGGSG